VTIKPGQKASGGRGKSELGRAQWTNTTDCLESSYLAMFTLQSAQCQSSMSNLKLVVKGMRSRMSNPMLPTTLPQWLMPLCPSSSRAGRARRDVLALRAATADRLPQPSFSATQDHVMIDILISSVRKRLVGRIVLSLCFRSFSGRSQQWNRR